MSAGSFLQAKQPISKNVELVGQFGGATRAVAVQGDYAYLGVGSRLVVMDITNPTHPTFVAQTDTLPDAVRSVAVVNNYAYLAAGRGGLQIIDIANPKTPTRVGSYTQTQGIAQSITILNNIAYMTERLCDANNVCTGGKLHLLDITNPVNPSPGNSYTTTGSANSVAVKGNYAYVADGNSGLCVLNITAPNAVCQPYDTPGSAKDVFVNGQLAYVADKSTLLILNISNPVSPTPAGPPYTPPGGGPYGISDVYSVVVIGNKAYVTDAGEYRWSLYIIDVSDPSNLVLIGRCDTGRGLDVFVAGNYAYVASDGPQTSGLFIVDVSQPITPIQASFYSLLSQAMGVAIAGNYAYVIDIDTGLHVINVTNPAAPVEVSYYDLPGQTRGIAIAEDRAYIANVDEEEPPTSNGLYIFSIADPFVRSPISFSPSPTSTSNWANGIAVKYPYAYVADFSALRIVEVANPPPLIEISHTITTRGQARNVDVLGNYAYVANGNKGLAIINVTNPITPTLAGVYTIPEYLGLAYDVDVSGNYAYVAGWPTLQIIDVTTPTTPTRTGVYTVSQNYDCALGVTVAGNYAYVASSRDGLRVVNVSNPAAPKEVGIYQMLRGNATNVAVAGDYIYLTESNGNGLMILRFIPPPTISGRVTDGSGNAIAGVTITTDSGDSAISNQDGSYTLAELPAGTFVITPSKSGYNFKPATRTVTVPPDAVGQNFVMLSNSVSTTLPMSGTVNLPTVLIYTDTQGLTTTLHFPAGAVTATTSFVLTPTLAQGHRGFTFAGHAFEVTAFQNGNPQPEFAFHIPVTVTIHYSHQDVRLVSDKSQLALWRWAGNMWEDATSTCVPPSNASRDLTKRVFSMPICHLSQYALLGPTNQVFLPLVLRQ